MQENTTSFQSCHPGGSPTKNKKLENVKVLPSTKNISPKSLQTYYCLVFFCNWATFKTLVTFHCTDWLLRILIMACHNLSPNWAWVVFHPPNFTSLNWWNCSTRLPFHADVKNLRCLTGSSALSSSSSLFKRTTCAWKISHHAMSIYTPEV